MDTITKFKVGDTVKQVQSGWNTDPEDNGKEAIVIESGGKYGEFDAIKIDTKNFVHKTDSWRGISGFELVEKDWD